MMDQRPQGGGWRGEESPQDDIADALDQPSFALVWLMSVLLLCVVAMVAVAMLLF